MAPALSGGMSLRNERTHAALRSARQAAPRSTTQAAIIGLGGFTSTLVDTALLAILVEAGAPVGPAAWAAACVGAVVSFAFSRRLAFRDRSPLRGGQVARFAAVALTTAMVLAAAMHVTSTVLGVPYLLAKLLCSALVFVVWSLPAQRHLVFSPSLDARASLTSF